MEESPGKMYALAIVLTLLALLAVALRFHARRIKSAGFAWDDYMILPALVFTIGTAACMIVGSAFGDLGRHTEIAPDGLPVINRRTQIFLQINYASQLTQTLTFGFTKLAVLLFYQRIFGRGRIFPILLWSMVKITILWTIAFFFANLFQCGRHLSINWTGFGGTFDDCIDTKQMYLAQAWSDVFTDVAILSLPIPLILSLQMPLSRRFAVSGIFLLGALVVVAGAAKLIAFRRIAEEVLSGNNDITYVLTPTLYWPMVESSLGVVGACLPSMRPVFVGCSSQGFVRKLREFSYFSSLHSKSPNDQEDSATRTSDTDSATIIAYSIPPKMGFQGSAAIWYDPDHDSEKKRIFFDSCTSGESNMRETETFDLEKQISIAEMRSTPSKKG